MLKKTQWAVAFTWQTAWQNTRWKSPVEVTQFPQHPTPSTSELHSIGPWPTRNIYLSSRWKSTHGATYFDDWPVPKRGAHFDVLQTSKTALAFAPAKYCSPVWCWSVHTHRLDAALNNGLRLVSGCIRSTSTFILPVVSVIMPPDIRRNKQTITALPHPPCWSRRPARATQHCVSKHTRTKAIAIPPHFLRECKTTHQRRSRKDQQGVGRRDLGNEMGHHTLPIKNIQTPSNKPIGHDLARYSLVRLNRIRTGYGRFKTPIWTRWDCRHQHRVSVVLQTRPHNTLPASVRCTVVRETWRCWTLQHETGCTTCSVMSKIVWVWRYNPKIHKTQYIK